VRRKGKEKRSEERGVRKSEEWGERGKRSEEEEEEEEE